eukprot:scaffold8471_cov184-Amphora_coffeaeformis.AAC.21
MKTTNSSASCSSLPEDAWQSIALYLDAPGVLALTRVSHRLNQIIDRDIVWEALWKRDQDNGTEDTAKGTAPKSSDDQKSSPHPEDAPPKHAPKKAKEKFLQVSYLRCLPLVTWHALEKKGPSPQIYGREAHLACVLGNYQLVTQGFTGDENIYIKDTSLDGDDAWQAVVPTLRGDARLRWAYGCTLTPFTKNNACAAIRYGGFRAGGYSHETNQVALLCLEEKQQNDDDDDVPVATSWEVLQIETQSGEALHRVDHKIGLSRAYHAAELVLDRFLVIIGGIQSRIGSSILKPIILDTHTWTWMDEVTVDLPSCENEWPSGRHGNSLIWDQARQRLVLFGGATGCDIIHSGVDVCDVWQLAPKDPLTTPLTHESFIQSLPWRWTRLHEDQNRAFDFRVPTSEDVSPTRLSSAESLCLGRCHGAHQVSRDAVVFVFGSSRPSTNGIIGYDLSCDEFRRPRVQGIIPAPRLCFASAFLPQQNAIWVHSGWSTQSGGVVHHSRPTCMALLQLVPSYEESNDYSRCHVSGIKPVSDHEARLARRRRMSMGVHGGIFGLVTAFAGTASFR